ncbi:hypothetical protein [Roseimaritima multifibrata]|uniref:hypothetical protein n=1 Tax=Roseimaritima multifibrata TaxID=1930274 RepID=UPI0011A99ABF|nr:hypothetical protein [Roseimaritima multifibrata]
MNDIPRKQNANIYTVMLLVSMLFMLVAVIAMFVEFRRYEGTLPWKTDEARPQVMHHTTLPTYF